MWLAVFALSLSRHTPWRDEYQSWLVSTRTETLPAFFDGVRHERHPPLHYLLQRGLAQVLPTDFTPKTQIELVTAPFTIGIVVLILFFLDLPLSQSAMLIFGIYIFREYGVISRAYSLGLFFLLLSVYFRRKSRELAADISLLLSANTHLLFTLVAGSLFLVEKWDWRKAIRSARFWVISTLFAATMLFQAPPADSLFNRPPDHSLRVLWKLLRYSAQILWPLEAFWKPFKWNSLAVSTDFGAVLLLPLGIYWLSFWVDLRKLGLVVALPLLLLCTSADTFTRHLGVVFCGFLAAYLLYPRKAKDMKFFRSWPEPLLAMALVGAVSNAAWWIKWAPYEHVTKFDFSEGQDLAAKLAVKEQRALMITDDVPIFFTWMANAGLPVVSTETNALQAYPYFVKLPKKIRLEDWCAQHLGEWRPNAAELYLGLMKGHVPPESCKPFNLVYESEHHCVTDEEYSVYRLIPKAE